MAPKGVVRVKTGCITCRSVTAVREMLEQQANSDIFFRIRRVKCDEGRPSCQKCLSTGRKCDGYRTGAVGRNKDPKSALPISPLSASSPKLLKEDDQSCKSEQESPIRVRSLHILPFESDDEKRSFDCFLMCASVSTAQFITSAFWEGLVLPASHQEPTIKHLALALGTFHRRWSSPDAFAEEARDSRIVKHYLTAIQQMSQLLENRDNIDNLRTALMACVLFVALDIQVGNYSTAYMHLEQGLRIRQGPLRKFRRRKIPDDPNEVPLDNICNTLARIDLQAMTFNDNKVTYPFENTTFESEEGLDMGPDTAFHSLAEARRAIVDLVRAAMRLSRSFSSKTISEEPYSWTLQPLHEHKIKFDTNLLHWETAFDCLRSRFPPSSGGQRLRNAYTMLSIYHKIAQIMLTGTEKGTESGWDSCIPIFVNLISLTEEMIFAKPQSTSVSFELGTVVPLFLTAIKCRDPCARRRAITLLDEADRCEGFWHSRGAARVAEAVMQIEEESAKEITKLPCILSAADVPDHARVNTVAATGKLKDQKLNVRCWRRVLSSDKSPLKPHIIDVGIIHF